MTNYNKEPEERLDSFNDSIHWRVFMTFLGTWNRKGQVVHLSQKIRTSHPQKITVGKDRYSVRACYGTML